MVWTEKEYHSIPGTYVFDGKRSASAYALNKLLYSLNEEENRAEYHADPAKYADKYGLPDEHKNALINGEFLKVLHLGANIYYMAKLAVPAGLSVQDVGAAFHGKTTEEFLQHLLDQSGFQTEIKDLKGYWNG